MEYDFGIAVQCNLCAGWVPLIEGVPCVVPKGLKLGLFCPDDLVIGVADFLSCAFFPRWSTSMYLMGCSQWRMFAKVTLMVCLYLICLSSAGIVTFLAESQRSLFA